MCARKIVTESSEDLLLLANIDILGVKSRLEAIHGFSKNERIVSVSGLQIAAEKIFKGYLRKNNITVFWL